MSERRMLHKKGTRAMMLTPGSLVSTAKADLARRARNKQRAEKEDGGYERFAFLPIHVKNAKSVAGLLAKAISDLERRPELMKAKLAKRGDMAATYLYNADLIEQAILLARNDHSPAA